MSSHKIKSFILGILISSSFISIIAYAHSDGVFGEYFDRMVQPCGLPGSTIINGFSSGSTDYSTISCTSLFDLLGTIFGPSVPPANSSVIGFSSTGEIIYAPDTWKETGLTISYTGGNVGIGTNIPSTKLHISNGDININNWTNIIIWDASAFVTTSIAANGSSHFNWGNIGIGTNIPTEKLDVIGSVHISETLDTQAINLGGDNLQVPIVCTDANKALQWDGTNWLCN